MAKRFAPVLVSVPSVPMTQRVVICFSCGDVCVLYEYMLRSGYRKSDVR
jgi:hypothetical protein